MYSKTTYDHARIERTDSPHEICDADDALYDDDDVSSP